MVVPVYLVVSGLGLEQLTSAYDPTPPVAQSVIPVAVGFLVVTPLMTAMCIKVLEAVGAGEPPSAKRALVEGFEAFTPLFFAMVMAGAGIAVGLLLIVPGIYLAVRWLFVPQAVVIGGQSGAGALRHSMEATQGFWWRTFGVLLLANLAAALPGLLIAAPLASVAQETGRAVWVLVGATAAETITAPFVALVATLLYFDLRERGPYRP